MLTSVTVQHPRASGIASEKCSSPRGLTRTKALGTELMERSLRVALPAGDAALGVGAHAADALARASRARPRRIVMATRVETIVDLYGHRAASDLDELVARRQRSLGHALRSAVLLPVPRGRTARVGRRAFSFARVVDPARSVGSGPRRRFDP